MSAKIIKMLEASKNAPDLTQPTESRKPDAVESIPIVQSRLLVRVAMKLSRALNERRSKNPQLVDELRCRQEDPGIKKRNAGSKPDILDMRLD